MSRERPISEYDNVHNTELTISRAISSDPNQKIPFADSSNSAYALYDFQRRNNHELSITRGSKLKIHQRGSVWHMAENETGERGLVPQNYIAEEDDILECPALFKYETKSANQLSFEAGDTLLIINRINDHWVEGFDSKGNLGLVPVAYIDTGCSTRRVTLEKLSVSKSTLRN